ncbi:protein with 4 transmembrane domains and a RING domain [Cryptosporidium sp. chipmunk genotype I]|uniref:protein with 4 transmembrane domains and a RING domain n=1 Tax=Cryptosporidium sp. chipmunk genotype I TaxID=1280935 RepID=UPI00351A33C7|nr:protein with 4 transmembrane domains and a RING domain [Cryptosporidium sp. chipmunk genotype I]
MRSENGIVNFSQKLTLGKHVLRAALILSILLPFIMEIYFLIPNFVSFYSGKEWVRVLLNENHRSELGSVSKSNSTESDVIDRMGIDKNNNILVMLIKDPMYHIIIQGSFLEKSVSENRLRRSMRGVKPGEVNDSFSESKVLKGDRLLVRKDHCNCPILENSFPDIVQNENGEFYSLILDGENSVNNPILILVISLILLLFKWAILLIYIVTQLFLPIKAVREVVNRNLLKSSAISIFYVTSTSLSLTIVGIEAKDCINWWFLGSSPEYLLLAQVFIWLIASICIFLYFVQYFLEIVLNISRRHKLLNDFITTSIFIPAGLLVIVSISLCILGIIKPWIFMSWITTVMMEFEKNVRILAKVYDEDFSLETETSSSRNFIFFNRVNSNNIREERRNEINIVELREDIFDDELEKMKEKNSKLNRRENDMVIIPISNSYFKILDYSFENFSTKLCLWYITQHSELENRKMSKIELEEHPNKNLLRIFEFSTSGFVNNMNSEEKYTDKKFPEIYSKANSLSSDSTISRINSFHTENISENSNNQFICNICFLDFDSIIIFSPCGHGSVCLDCLGDYISNNFKLKQHPKCHICREDILKMIEIQKNKEQTNRDKHILEEAGSFELTLSKKINANNQNSEREIHLISNTKLIAEISCNSRNCNSLSYSRSSSSEFSRSSDSSIITLKISRKNSDLWSHPRIKEFINDHKTNKLRTWVYNHFIRFFTNSNRRIS